MTRTQWFSFPLLLLALILFASQASATLVNLSVVPSAPTVCDSVTIEAHGVFPNSCYDIVGAVLRGPVPVTCITEPCPAEYFVEITVREPDPAEICLASSVPYTRSFPIGKLPATNYVVMARERVIPWFADSTDSILGYSERITTFVVRNVSCVPGAGCYILNLHDPTARLNGPCDGSAAPGGTACLPVNLSNSVNVGGLQTTLSAISIETQFPTGSFHVTSVEPVRRAAGFQASWSEQDGRTKILLYSTSGAVIPPGDGPVLRVCFSVDPQTPPSRYWVLNQNDIVADPEGNALLPCPTPAIFAPGVLCVVTPGCDLNSDGVSDVLDIIRMVRCILGAPNDSIPCTASTDCNVDGTTDIRDVLCCVRKIVQARTGHAPPPYPVGFAPGEAGVNQIGFLESVRWTSSIQGIANLRVDAAADWGGTQFSINTNGAPVRVRSMELQQAPAGVKLEWAAGDDGIARAILYSGASGSGSAWSGRILVTLDRVSDGTGTIHVGDVMAGTASGTRAGILAANPVLWIDAGPPPAAPQLFAARPNPFTATTEIVFVLPTDAPATLHIYDVQGRLVRTLASGARRAGPHFARWDGTDGRGHAARSGIYFAKLTVGTETRTERIMLLR